MEWVRVIESKGGVLSDKTLLIKAYEIAKKHLIKTFKDSSSWLDKFKARNNIKERILSGEGFKLSSVDFSAWYDLIKEKMRNYKPSEIYNGDETALFYKMIPSRKILTKIRQGARNIKIEPRC
ncbi:Tigger transposable element-derived protein 4, partial [Cucumispora dikerogammari]